MRPRLAMLDDELIAGIVAEALRILATIGMEVRGVELRRRLLERGLGFDRAGERLLFPEEVVRRAIATAPSSFVLYERDGEPHAEIGGGDVHFVPGSSGLKVLDHRTAAVRLATTADFVEYVRVGDGLKHLPYLATAFSTNADIEPAVSDAWRLHLALLNTRKPIVSGAFTEHGVPRMAEMMALFRRDRADLASRPMSIFTITATGNFRYGEDSCQNLLDCVEAGIPVEIVPVTLMGLIAPVTLVGATVFHTVDVLAGVTIAQLLRPGAPVLFGGAPAAFHMRTASSPMAAIEAQALVAAYVAVGKSLGLPTQAYMGLSDAKTLDAQAGAETFGSALVAALAGVDSVSGPGFLDFLLVFSLPKLVFDDEIIGQVLRFVREVRPVDDLPTDRLVHRLLTEQHLLTADHTTTNWPAELYLPSPAWERENRENWLKAGGQDAYARATSEAERRLAAYRGIETDPTIVAELERIVRSGLREQTELPAIPSLPDGSTRGAGARERRRNPRRADGTH